MGEVRIDKWLWAVRVFKTRSLATDACKMNRVSINGQLTKPSRLVKEGDVISVRKPPIEYSFKVLRVLNNRVGAKLVPEYMENVTPKEQYDILELQRLSRFVDRAKGLGRPTKKDRRDMESFIEDMPAGMELFDWDEDWDD
ncbi:MAG: RNA-binding S4 domain-containing protein [Porphyromonas sp.]|jgi:heat shock protein 15|nr:RNA-binding S4 domain-containing protein [Porphyromonas sp.]RKW47849.1 MAG: RNA-binding S4 domain-containing protein [Porphyromonas sp.]